MSSYGQRVSRPFGANDKAFGGGGMNLPANCLEGEGDMVGVFDDFNGVILTEAGNGTAHWETMGWTLADFGSPVADGVGMNDIDDVSEAFTSSIWLNCGTADDAGLNMQLDRINSATPVTSGGYNFPHIWLAENTTATALDNTTFVFATRIGVVPEGTTFDGKVFIGWGVAGETTVMTAATGALAVAGAEDQLLGFHINGDAGLPAPGISGIAQRVGNTAYVEGTNFTELIADSTWNTGLTAGSIYWFDLALRMDVTDWSATSNGTTRFYHRGPLSSVTSTSGRNQFDLPGEGYQPWTEHSTVLQNQTPNHSVALVPTIEAVNGPAGGEIDVYVDWWTFGMSRFSR